jgi:hypothetical protein
MKFGRAPVVLDTHTKTQKRPSGEVAASSPHKVTDRATLTLWRHGGGQTWQQPEGTKDGAVR